MTTHAKRMAHYKKLIAEAKRMLAKAAARRKASPRWVAPEECPF